MNFLSGPTEGLLQAGFDIWNHMTRIVWGMLEQTPQTIDGGSIWDKLQGVVEPLFVGIGTALVIVFFFWGWVKNSVDMHEDVRLENILRMLIRVVVAEFLVLNNFNIMKIFFEMVGNAVRALGTGFGIQTTVNESGATVTGEGALGVQLDIDKMEDLKAAIESEFWLGLAVFLIALIAFLVIAVLSVMLVLTVYARFIKLFIVLPLGTLAFSSFAGDREIAHSSSAYFRYILGLTLEAVAMGLALIVSGLLINSGVLFISSGATGFNFILLYLVQICLQLAITLGTVKGAHELVSRTLGV